MRVLNVVGSLRVGGGIEHLLLRTLTAIRHLEQKQTPMHEQGQGPEQEPEQGQRRHAAGRSGPLQIEICYIGRRPPELEERFAEIGVAVWRCRESFVPGVFAGRFAAALRSRPPFDVIHTHNSNFGAPALRTARRLGVPVRLAHYHNLTSGHANDPLRRMVEAWMARQVLQHATGICAVAAGVLRARFGEAMLRDPRARVIPAALTSENAPVDDRAAARAALGIPADALVIGHVGRFVPQKNHAGLLDAAARVMKRDARVWLLLVGDGPLRGEVERRAAALEIAERCRFAGVRKDIGAMYAAMDLFFLPSREEGLGVVLIEAQAAGLPVVASRLATTDDAIAPEAQRWIRAWDDAPGFADALEQAIGFVEQGGDEPAALRAAARSFAARFTPQAAARALLDAWGA
ncbi:MAG: glycosyltransferase [Phycisphaerales bacterium]|nr:glycosyltransferase [Phycisphaerales bacterium]